MSDSPQDIIRSILGRHLPKILFDSSELENVRVTPRVIDCYLDPFDQQKRISTEGLGEDVRAVLKGHKGSYVVVAMVDPQFTQGDMLVLLTDERRLLMFIWTEVSERDGVLQLFGGELGVVLVSDEEFASQQGKTLYRGDSLRSFSIEVRKDGSWERIHPLQGDMKI